MKYCDVTVSDAIHAQIEKMTNPLLPERVAVDKVKTIKCLLTGQTDETLSLYSNGYKRKKEAEKRPTKNNLCAALLIGFFNTYKKMPQEWRQSRLIEFRLVCAEIQHEQRQKLGQNIGAHKITKRLMFSAILHYLVKTQDVKTFFDKML